MQKDTLILAATGFGLLLFAILVIGLIVSRLFVRASKETAFVRTGFGGQKVIVSGGSLVVPVLHEIIRVNMNTLRLEVRRGQESGLITKDRIRVDVQAEFFVRVKPTEDAIADAAQTLGLRTQKPEALKELVEGKFVDALRAVAAEMTMEELHEQRVNFVQRVQTTVSEDILKNGLELESVSLTSLDQTAMEFLNPNNAFDAQGLAKLTEMIEAKKKHRNDVEQETKVLIQMKNLESEQKSLGLVREQEYARMEQEREIAIRKAAQGAEIARERSQRDQEAMSAEIAAKQATDQARIASERRVQEDQIATERGLRELDVQKAQSLETAAINKQKALEMAEQDRAIAIAEKSRAQSVAQAEAATARAEAVRAEEQVITVKEREGAERRKAIELLQASETAERDAIKITVAAQADRRAGEDRAAAIRIQAEAEAQAVTIRAEAAARQYEVDAAGRRQLNEAGNLVSDEAMATGIRHALIERLPEIIRESVKPMERIDGIKIIQVEGLTGSGAGVSSASPSDGSLADGLVNSALRYRGQAPLVDALMAEIGMAGGDLNGLTKGLEGGKPAGPKK